VTLVQARVESEYAAAHELMVEYAESLGIDLCFQNFSSELQDLRGVYGPPRGCLWLASHEGVFVGCVGVRQLSGTTCEMKRLYVRTAARGGRIGHSLAVAAIDSARAMGYERMLLDTLAEMTGARRLYATLGFRESAPYYDNPIPSAIYMELDLR
jgi:ribosomal protein S18 acetylase RimI-like enzyme